MPTIRDRELPVSQFIKIFPLSSTPIIVPFVPGGGAYRSYIFINSICVPAIYFSLIAFISSGVWTFLHICLFSIKKLCIMCAVTYVIDLGIAIIAVMTAVIR